MGALGERAVLLTLPSVREWHMDYDQLDRIGDILHQEAFGVRLHLRSMRSMGLIIIVWVQGYLFAPELIKLPMLWMHFDEHHESDPFMGFGDFLALHYGNESHEDADHQGHQGLPFHHHHGATSDGCVMKVWFGDALRQVSFPEEAGQLAVAIPKDDELLGGHMSELLRPPRPLA